MQPVIVHYKSDLPMILLGAHLRQRIPNMGILVWVLGDSRAIPRNFYETVLNDAAYDWTGTFSNYERVVFAVSEAPNGQAYLRSQIPSDTSPIVGLLDPNAHFGSLDALRAIKDPAAYVAYLKSHQFPFEQNLYAVLRSSSRQPRGSTRTG